MSRDPYVLTIGAMGGVKDEAMCCRFLRLFAEYGLLPGRTAIRGALLFTRVSRIGQPVESEIIRLATPRTRRAALLEILQGLYCVSAVIRLVALPEEARALMPIEEIVDPETGGNALHMICGATSVEGAAMYPHEMMQMALIGLVVDLRISPFEEDALGRFPIDRLHPCYMASCNVLIKLMRETAERERGLALALVLGWQHHRRGQSSRSRDDHEDTGDGQNDKKKGDDDRAGDKDEHKVDCHKEDGPISTNNDGAGTTLALGMLPEDLLIRIVRRTLPSVGLGFDDGAGHYL